MTDETREERELEVLFGTLDNHPPRATLEAVIGRAEGRARKPWRLAAGIAAALAVSGAAWALPGSPVPGWVRSALGVEEDPVPPVTDEGPAGAGEAATPGGMAFDVGEELHVAVDRSSAGVLRIAITTEPRIVVQAVSGEARFTSAPNRLDVVLGRPDTLEVRIPERSARVVVTVGGNTVFSKTGDAVASSLARDSRGRWVREMDGGG